MSKLYLKRVLLFLLFIFFEVITYAQKFENVGVKNGLSSHQAYNVVSDKNGFIWVSTKSGIDRYNGESIENYSLIEQRQSEVSQRTRLATDTEKNIWAYTINGNIYKYIEGKNRFELKVSVQSLLNRAFNVFKVYIDDSVWIATNLGLYIYDIKSEQLVATPEFENENVHLVSRYKNNKLLIALSNRLVVFERGVGVTDTILRQKKKDKYSWIRSVFLDQGSDEIWIGTREGEVYIYNETSDNVQTLRNKIPQLPQVPINKIVSTSSTIYIGSDGGGIFVVDKNRKVLLNNLREDEDKVKSIRGNGVQDLLLTPSNDLLATTFTGGLNVLYNFDTPFHILRHEINNANSLRNNVVNSILEDDSGDLWFATNNGVSRWLRSRGKWKHYLDNNESTANVFLSLFQNGPNSIMAGSYSKGIYLIDKTKGVIDNILPGKDNPNYNDEADYIVEIYKDAKDKIWTGGPFKDISIYDPGKNQYYYLPLFFVTSIQTKDEDHIFVGTSNGIFVVNIHSLEYYQETFNSAIETSVSVNSLNFDKEQQILWIATSGAGILKYNIRLKRMERLNTIDGMPSNHVYAILRDKNEDIWASTEKGLVKYNTNSGTIESFSQKTGLSDISFYKNSKLRDGHGNIYFGSYEGVTYFNPDQVKQNKIKVKLFFDSFLIDNRVVTLEEKKSPLKTSLNQTKALRLKYDQNSFSFKFTSIIPPASGDIRYSWILEGQDGEWTLPSLNTTANYTNLGEGEYQFKIRAIGNNNTDYLDERAIMVIIPPAPWNTVWARLLYLLSANLILIAIIKYNSLNNKKKLSEAKIKFFIDTAHNILTPLTLAATPLTDLEKSENLNEKEKYYLKLSSSNLKKLSESMSHLLDFQKSDLGKIRLVVSKVDIIEIVRNKIDDFHGIAQEKGIHIDFICESTQLEEFVDSSKLNKIIDNLLSNAFKYTGENGSIALRLEATEKQWTLQIVDTGIGISANAQKELFKRYYRASNAINSKINGTGIGLLLVRDYVRLHKGKIEFESKENFGTKFKVIFLRGKAHYGDAVTYTTLPETARTDLSSIGNIASNVSLKRDKRKRLKVLIVEDNDELRNYLEQAIGELFYAKSANNAKMALVMIKKFFPDFVVLDIGLPGMNGIELTKRLKSQYETSHIPILHLTAFREKSDVLAGLESGADDYITKPFDTALLMARIENILKNREYIKNRFIRSVDNKEVKGLYANKKDQEFIQKASDFIKENLTNPNLSKEYFAQSMFVSQTLLYQKIKILSGQSPSEFIKVIRLKQAARLLNEGSRSINEISNLTGFSDSKYFSTSFKKFYGKSPSKYAALKSTNSKKEDSAAPE